MKLYSAGASPFVRKARLVAHEAGVADRLELIETDTIDPGPDGLPLDNPLAKVPCLVLDEATGLPPLFDSRVVCEYLDAAFNGGRLFCADGPPERRFRALRWQAIADGVMEALVLCRYERVLRAEGERSESWVERQRGKARRAVAQLEREAAEFTDPPHIGLLAVAAALGYADFRFPDWDWRRDRPGLAAWYAGFAERPSMRATEPTG